MAGCDKAMGGTPDIDRRAAPVVEAVVCLDIRGQGKKNRSATRVKSEVAMRKEKFAIASIYVPVKRRATLKSETVQAIAQSMLEVGQQAPILVRRDGDRLVLVHGLHRLEACKALGEETIDGYVVAAPKH